MKTRILSLTMITAMTGGAALAGSADPVVVEATPAVPIAVAPAAPVGSWTGAYGGLSFGGTRGEIGNADESGAVYGLFGGYDHQIGKTVLGGEIEIQGNDNLSVGAVDVDNVARAKARLGYDLGDVLVYGTAGVSKIETSFGDATAPVYGIGAEYKLTERFGVGAEYLSEDFKNLGATSTDLSSDSLSLRGTLRF